VLRTGWLLVLGFVVACSGASGGALTPTGDAGGSTSSSGAAGSSGGGSGGAASSGGLSSSGANSSGGITAPEGGPREDAGHEDGGHAEGGHADGGHGGSSGSGSSSGSSSGSGSGSGSGSSSGGGSSSGTASSSGAFAPFVPADMPQDVDFGGPLLTAPVFQSISFAGYDQTAQVDDFIATVGATSFWSGAVGEYGIGTPTVQPPIHLPTAAPTTIDDTAIQTWLQGLVAAGDAGAMAPTAGSLYVIWYPSTSTVTLDGLTSCQQFGGYHNSTSINGVNVAYAVVPECTFPGMTALQTTTGSASHELIEASTDPQPLTSSPAYADPDNDHTFMAVVLGGGEIGDLCAQWPTSFFTPAGYAYQVQRPWSNVAATAGRDPCQPELPGETYFAAVPPVSDAIHVTYQGTSYPTGGISIAPGASKTVPVQLYSEAPKSAWTVGALEWPDTGHLTFAWDSTTGQNGTTLNLTITVSSEDTNYGGEAFVVESSDGASTTYVLGFVGQ
jgi:hypothetical protein